MGNFKVRCIKDCYDLFNCILFKAGKEYEFVNGVCMKEGNIPSQEYLSFRNFIYMNSNWKDNFVEI